MTMTTDSTGVVTPQNQQLPLVINTRPCERAAPLTEHLSKNGFGVVELPLLDLATRETSADDLAMMASWLKGSFQALVIVSPTAAESGLKAWQQLIDNGLATALNQPPSHIIAVGDATAKVLHDSNLTRHFDILQPLIANNEGMLAMPEVAALQQGDRLLVWRGLGGRRLLVDTLAARGVGIDSIAWYERLMPDEAAANFEKWQQAYAPTSNLPRPVVIVSSGTAFENWQAILSHSKGEVNNLNSFTYVVLGERLANMVASCGLDFIRVEDLSPQTILAAILAQNPAL